MSSLTYNDKARMAQLFGFDKGYIFSYIKEFNKTDARDMIFEATGIDIFTDPNYSISQERCIRKVWDECGDNEVGKLMLIMLKYYHDSIPYDPDDREMKIYCELCELAKKLMKKKSVTIPNAADDNLQLIKKDIEHNIAIGNPELSVDRLHTYATSFFRELCVKHGINTTMPNGEPQPLHSLAGSLKNWYRDNSYFESDFCVPAFQYSINTFQKFNDVRNDESAAHPNALLSKAEAEFVVRIITDTLVFIERIEAVKDKEATPF